MDAPIIHQSVALMTPACAATTLSLLSPSTAAFLISPSFMSTQPTSWSFSSTAATVYSPSGRSLVSSLTEPVESSCAQATPTGF